MFCLLLTTILEIICHMMKNAREKSKQSPKYIFIFQVQQIQQSLCLVYCFSVSPGSDRNIRHSPQRCSLVSFVAPLHQGNVISLLDLGPAQVSSGCKRLCISGIVSLCHWVDIVIDDEDEQINTKALSRRLHSNFPWRVGTVSQQAHPAHREEEEIIISWR